jgi:hypothetical protein
MKEANEHVGVVASANAELGSAQRNRTQRLCLKAKTADDMGQSWHVECEACR